MKAKGKKDTEERETERGHVKMAMSKRICRSQITSEQEREKKKIPGSIYTE